jgi:hypothetical protein
VPGDHHHHWGQIGAAIMIGGVGLDVAWYLATQASRPWWPFVPFSALAAVGLYLVVARIWDWPVPLDKADRLAARKNRSGAGRAAESARRGREIRLQQEKRRAWADTQWWGRAQYGANCWQIELQYPHADTPDDFVGSIATCAVSLSAALYTAREPVPFHRPWGSFVVEFPTDFEGFEWSIPTGMREFCVWWKSDAFGDNQFRHQRFRVLPSGLLVGGGLDPDHPSFSE